VGTEIALMALDGAGATAEEESSDGEAPTREDTAAKASTEEFSVAEAEAQPAVERGEKQRAVAAGARGSSDGHREVESAETLRLTRSSPVVRRLAEEYDVDIAEIPGTGTGGRVTKKDIEGYVEGREEEYAPPGLRDKREAFARPRKRRRQPERRAGPPESSSGSPHRSGWGLTRAIGWWN
jgi:pyruvate/2-oxoglutarate dehydrogenase complex dihydrolipoamide acyltransferase (E2) component